MNDWSTRRMNMSDQNLLIHSVVEILSQGETLLQEIDDATYVRKLPAAFNASIGGHYRHSLDHFRRLIDVAEQGDLNYDLRERGTLIENDRYAALNATRDLREAYEQLTGENLARVFRVTCKISYGSANSQTALSTFAREIMYSVAHAVHHYALIGIMGGLMGIEMPPGFGVAPSTLKHQREQEVTVAR